MNLIHPFLPDAYLLTMRSTGARAYLSNEELRLAGFKPSVFYGFNAVEMGLASPNARMTQGMLGCLLSHMALWKHVQVTRRPALIFEDDIILATNAKATMTQAYRFALPSDWSVVFWGSCWQARETHEPVNKSFDRAFCPPMCFHAYMIHPRAVDAVLHRLNVNEPIDVQTRLLFQSIGGIYVHTDPTLATQHSLLYTDERPEVVSVVGRDDGVFKSQTCKK